MNTIEQMERRRARLEKAIPKKRKELEDMERELEQLNERLNDDTYDDYEVGGADERIWYL